MFRIRFFVLLFVLCSSLGATDETPLQTAQHKAMHWIVIPGAAGTAGCTANAISEHVLITAEHCSIDTGHAGVIYIDHSKAEVVAGAAHFAVTEKYFDNADHVLLVIPGASFADTIPYNFRAPKNGEHIYFWGNPAGIRDIYREGTKIGKIAHDEVDQNITGDLDLYQLPVIGGDSGSTFFGENGEAVGITTYAVFGGVFMGAYPVLFTPAQIAAAEGKTGASCSVETHKHEDEDGDTVSFKRYECKP
jgi:hypothetical protein